MDFVYHIWYLAERYFSNQLYEQFFNQAIKLIKKGTESDDMQMVLYNNQVLGSKALIYNICMALIYLDRFADAHHTIDYHFKNFDKKKEIKEE